MLSSLIKWFQNSNKSKAQVPLKDRILKVLEAEIIDPLEIEERILIRNSLEVMSMTAEDIMIPRADIIAIHHNSSFTETSEIIHKQMYTRYPIYRDSLDDIFGFIHVKDVVHHGQKETFNIKKMMHPVLFVPASTKALALLSQMRLRKLPLAVVVDEYGGVDGLVTAWDIIREVFGELQDPHIEEYTPQFHKSKDGSYILDARYDLDDFEENVEKILTKEERDEDLDTVGGLVLFLAGRVPNRNEVISHSSGYEFEILEANPRTVISIRVVKQKSD